jgi:hypothetical protein
VDADGRMLAGTESPGRLYRFDSSDKPFVLLDTGLAELRAVSSDASGVLFAAAVAKGEESASAGETTSVAVTLAAAPTSARRRRAVRRGAACCIASPPTARGKRSGTRRT